MSKLHVLSVIALSTFMTTAAFASQPRDNAQTAANTLACSTNPSQEFCQVASNPRDDRKSQVAALPRDSQVASNPHDANTQVAALPRDTQTANG
jgi:hypothetical protein